LARDEGGLLHISLPTKRTAIVLVFFFLCLLAPQALRAQNSNSSKIPEGEAHFTPQQLEQYYLVYKNSDVRYLRTTFDAYLKGTAATDEREILEKWDKAYFRSKFVVLSRDANTFGGSLITILFEDRPDKVFVAWVYPEGASKRLTLRGLHLANFTAEDVKRINVRYKAIIEDKKHAM
jgi:hypothetical protein